MALEAHREGKQAIQEVVTNKARFPQGQEGKTRFLHPVLALQLLGNEGCDAHGQRAAPLGCKPLLGGRVVVICSSFHVGVSERHVALPSTTLS